jgi:hypothetical protein
MSWNLTDVIKHSFPILKRISIERGHFVSSRDYVNPHSIIKYRAASPEARRHRNSPSNLYKIPKKMMLFANLEPPFSIPPQRTVTRHQTAANLSAG